jgi:hypothetical protein
MKKSVKSLVCLGLAAFGMAGLLSCAKGTSSVSTSVKTSVATSTSAKPTSTSAKTSPSASTSTAPAVVHVASVTLSAAKASIAVGDTLQIQATVLPDNATNKALTYTVDNADIADISATGLLTAKKVGSVVVTGTTVDGAKVGTLTIKIDYPEVIFEAEDAVFTGATVSSEGGHGGKCLGSISSATVVTYKIRSTVAQKATLRVSTAIVRADHNGEHFNSLFTITVNGETYTPSSDVADNNGTAGWLNFCVFNLGEINLVEGANVIVLSGMADGWTNLDYLSLSSATDTSWYKLEIPDGTGTDYIFEGEDATMGAGALGLPTVADQEGAHGGKTLNNINNNTGATLTYRISSDQAKQATIYIDTAIGGVSVADTMSLTANTAAVETLTTLADPDANWFHYKEYKFASVNLVAGVNTFVFTVTGGIGNFDYVKFVSEATLALAENDPVLFEAENATLTSCNVQTDTTASGGKYVGGVNASTVVTYSLISASAQEAHLRVSTAIARLDANGSHFNSLFTINVNGTAYTPATDTAENNGTPGWTNFCLFDLGEITLASGKNTIVLHGIDGGWTNLDYLSLSTKAEVKWDTPLVIPDGTGTSYIYEGEDATLGAGATGLPTVADQEGAHGGKTLNNTNNNTGATLTYTLTSDKESQATVYLCTAIGGTSVSGVMTLTANGTAVETVSTLEDASANWTHYMEFKFAAINLIAGSNTLVFTITGGIGNFDYVKLITEATLTVA